MKHFLFLCVFLTSCYDIGPVAPVSNICTNNKVLSPTIANGETTNLFPEVCRIADKIGTYCSCILIGKQTVLTAAHCVDSDINTSNIIFGNNIIRNVISHTSPQKGDIALMTLNEPITVINSITISYQQPKVGDNILLLGYGKINTDNGPAIMPRELIFGCNKIVHIGFDGFSYNGYDRKTDTCVGDSGGPTYIDGLLAGIHVYSLYNKDGECGNGISVDVRVDYYLDWILDNMGNDNIKVGKIKRYYEQ